MTCIQSKETESRSGTGRRKSESIDARHGGKRPRANKGWGTREPASQGAVLLLDLLLEYGGSRSKAVEDISVILRVMPRRVWYVLSGEQQWTLEQALKIWKIWDIRPDLWLVKPGEPSYFWDPDLKMDILLASHGAFYADMESKICGKHAKRPNMPVATDSVDCVPGPSSGAGKSDTRG